MDLLKPTAANSPPLTPLGFLERAATVYGDCTSIIYNTTTYTWSQTYRRCLQLASALSSLGIGRRQVVSVFAPNLPAVYELHFAIPMCGAILNTLNTRLDAHTISILLRHGESKLIFVDSSSRSLVLEAISLFPPNITPPLLYFIMDDDDVHTSSSPAGDDANLTYEGLIAKGDQAFKWVRPETEWDPMVLNYTSGTTSAPKGVVHTHRGLFIMALDSLIDWSVPKRVVYLWTLPMFHGNGWSYTWALAAVGATNVCVRKFDGAAVYAAIRRYRITHMCGAPVVLNILANEPNQEPLPNPVQINTGGSPPPAVILSKMESLGFIVTHGFGMTETGGSVISCAWKPEWDRLPLTDRARLKARQGVRTAGMAEVDVIDPESGLSVKRDGSSIGEIVLRGGSITLGYFKNPGATAESMKGGWFHTGDMGVIHPDGYLQIKDRLKDVIISGGENVSSVEVESVLYSNPAVREAAVVARPHDFWGETPCAFVSLKPLESNKPSEKDIIEFCRAKLPHYMVPKTVVFIAELPKTSTGKIQKFVLRDMAKALGSSPMSRI
ncbi:2-methylpropanoate--CoA ligase CCL4-like [Telopea speciosissima]|uniref:2-methylpropanoate--CoA ligase CCL4-like n=1 Tax=Telopea speciosissima TaxID=54955 RepID=UPI001CC6F550|nr:2-methylpropanoate--CoA ligase CCL4-like [Telopea speciosissima]